jgi:hypothetical protein
MNSELDAWHERIEMRRHGHLRANLEWQYEFKTLCQLANFDGQCRDATELRRLVFNLPDAAARRALIAHYRKLHELSEEQAHIGEEQAKYSLASAQGSADHWWVIPSITTVILCIATGSLEQVLGSAATTCAIGIAAAGVLFGLNYRDKRRRSMREQLRFARLALADAQERSTEVRQERPIFTEHEAETGTPGPQRSTMPHR